MTSHEMEGREIDALVAQLVFGKRTRKVRFLDGYRYDEGHFLDDAHRITDFGEALAAEMDDGEVLYSSFGSEGPFIKLNAVPHYSTDIAAAWLVVEKLRPSGFGIAVADTPEGYEVTFDHMESGTCAIEQAPTLPLAICRAALGAVSANGR